MKILPATCVAVLLAGCADKKPDYFNGYAEADHVRLAAPVAGTLVKLYLNRGDRVEATHRVPGRDEVRRHRPAHVAQPQERDRTHARSAFAPRLAVI